LQVPTGWKIVVAMSPALRIRLGVAVVLGPWQHFLRREARDRPWPASGGGMAERGNGGEQTVADRSRDSSAGSSGGKSLARV
jgi:hypothetical protein